MTAATGSPDGFTVRDSADIEIIENHAPERSSDRFWAIDPEPVIVLGDDGTRGEIPAADSAHLVWRLSGYARLADGRMALLSYESARLMLFEPSGRFSKFIGRKGRGPGEFQRPEHLQYLPPDTLVVWDERFSTVAYFDTTGALLRHRRLDYGRIVAALRPLGRRVTGQSQPLPDGSFVAWVAGEGRVRRTPPPSPPWVRPSWNSCGSIPSTPLIPSDGGARCDTSGIPITSG